MSKFLSKRARLTAAAAWRNLNSRAGAKHESNTECYKKIKVRMSREEFMLWAVRKYKKWFRTRPTEKPSLDRKDPNGHYELGNLQLIEVGKNRNNNRRNKHKEAPKGKLHCGRCKQYLPKKDFYVVSTVAKHLRGHWTGSCKECSKLTRKEQWEAEHGKRPEPTGICERCERKLPMTEKGEVSRAQYCGSCRQALWQQRAYPLQSDKQKEQRREMAKLRVQRYRERLKMKESQLC